MIIHSLRASGSKKHKEICLAAYAGEIQKKMFLYAYHPDKMYYQKFSKIDLDTVQDPQEDMFGLLDQLSSRSITGGAARQLVEDYAEEHGDLIKMICNKDLDCGVTEKTLNKVFGSTFIPEFNIQLAEEVPIAKVQCPILCQIKYDGVRVLAMLDNGKVELRTRNNKKFSFPALEHVLNNCIGTTNLVLDGELVYDDGKSEGRTSVSGIVNSAIKGTPIEKENITFVVFDSIPFNDFKSDICSVPYSERYSTAAKAISTAHATKDRLALQHIKLADTEVINSTEELETRFQEVLKKGFEGFILKRWEHLYTFKRSRDWIKIKVTDPATLTVKAIQAGEGKYEGMIGALECYGTVKGKEVEVKVGSGLSDQQRLYDAEEFIGAKVDIFYNSIVQDRKTGKFSLFLPRFDRIRGDL